MNLGNGLNGVDRLIVKSTVVYAKSVITISFSSQDGGGTEGWISRFCNAISKHLTNLRVDEQSIFGDGLLQEISVIDGSMCAYDVKKFFYEVGGEIVLEFGYWVISRFVWRW